MKPSQDKSFIKSTVAPQNPLQNLTKMLRAFTRNPFEQTRVMEAALALPKDEHGNILYL